MCAVKFGVPLWKRSWHNSEPSDLRANAWFSSEIHESPEELSHGLQPQPEHVGEKAKNVPPSFIESERLEKIGILARTEPYPDAG